jgi:hypothetical protein
MWKRIPSGGVRGSRIRWLAAAAGVLLAVAPVRAGPVTIPTLFGTGLDAAGIPLVPPPAKPIDPHYEITTAPPGFATPLATKVIAADGCPIGVGGWFPNGLASQWIVPEPATADGVLDIGPYVYKTTFDLTGFDPSTVLITGGWAVDDAGFIKINDVDTGIVSLFGFSALTPIIIDAADFPAGTFLPGLNTLEFFVDNGPAPVPAGCPFPPDGMGYTGIQVRISGTAERAGVVPEPSTFALLGIGALGLLAYHWRRPTPLFT